MKTKKETPKELTKEEKEQALRDWQVLKDQGKVFDAKDVMQCNRMNLDAQREMETLEKEKYAFFGTEKGEEPLHRWKNKGNVLYYETLEVFNDDKKIPRGRILLKNNKHETLAYHLTGQVTELTSELRDEA